MKVLVAIGLMFKYTFLILGGIALVCGFIYGYFYLIHMFCEWIIPDGQDGVGGWTVIIGIGVPLALTVIIACLRKFYQEVEYEARDIVHKMEKKAKIKADKKEAAKTQVGQLSIEEDCSDFHESTNLIP